MGTPQNEAQTSSGGRFERSERPPGKALSGEMVPRGTLPTGTYVSPGPRSKRWMVSRRTLPKGTYVSPGPCSGRWMVSWGTLLKGTSSPGTLWAVEWSPGKRYHLSKHPVGDVSRRGTIWDTTPVPAWDIGVGILDWVEFYRLYMRNIFLHKMFWSVDNKKTMFKNCSNVIIIWQ